MKIGIALGGGGAKGLSHIGVLKVLQEHGLVPDMVAGTSIGALVGGLYVLRGNIRTVEEYALGFENSSLYPHLVPRPSSTGLISEKRIQVFLHGLFGAARIEDLERPFYCPAVDIRSGREVMFARGSLLQAVRASISVPVIFKPVRLRSSYLVDGGLLNPVPVDVLKRGGCDFTIAVNVITPRPLRPRRRRGNSSGDKLLLARLDDFLSRKLIAGRPGREPNVIESFLSTMEIMQQKLIAARLSNDAPDITIHVETSDFKFFEFYRPAEIIRRGEAAARLQVGAIVRGLRRLRAAGKDGS
ncbi:MAG: patatin-like phospholipase family protein [Acidobacteria bacterium]|jgi:NTE family protein|nr:patatin-like phospholipase family protein [Acidobacteriota bacterium]